MTLVHVLDLTTYLAYQRGEYRSPNDEESESEDSDDNGDTGNSTEAPPSSGIQEAQETPRGTYRKYSEQQWVDFFEEVTLRFGFANISAAAKKAGIHPRTAHAKYQKYLLDPSAGFPVDRMVRGGGPGRPPILKKEHTDFIIKFLGEKPEVNISELKTALVEAFNGLSVSDATLCRHIRKECRFSLQRRVVQPEAGYTDQVLENRKEWVEKWSSEEVFLHNSVFIDEAEFDVHMRGTAGWAPKGGNKSTSQLDKGTEREEKDDTHLEEPETATGQDGGHGHQQPVKRPSTVRVSTINRVRFSVIGAICWSGVAALSLRSPHENIKPETTKKQEAKHSDKALVETSMDYFTAFISHVMDVMDKADMRRKNLVMSGASIHNKEHVRALIEDRGFIPVYLPPCSPFLSPVDEYWTKISSEFPQREFGTNETVKKRIIEVGYKVDAGDIRGYMERSLSFFPRCLNKEEL